MYKLQAYDYRNESERKRLLNGLKQRFGAQGYRVQNSLFNGDDTIYFIGHIYPKNGLSNEGYPSFINSEQPLRFLQEKWSSEEPVRVIFGGDSVYIPTVSSFEQLLNLKQSVGNSRFLVGNHEADPPEELTLLHSQIFGARFGHEDIAGVRLIYLDTNKADGTYGIDLPQMKFLSKVLKPAAYKHAIIFMHHALWAGDTKFSNTQYKNTQALKAQWFNDLLPMFERAKVVAVIAGDGGVRAFGVSNRYAGILHTITGWSDFKKDSPPDWITIHLGRSGPSVMRSVLIDGKAYGLEQ